MKVALLTDSTSDLNPKWQDRLGAQIVPLRIKFDGRDWLDHHELSPSHVFRRVQEGAEMPVTEPPSLDVYYSILENLLQKHDHVICIHISSVLSGTVEVAQTAAKAFEGRVSVHDSLTTTAGLAMRVERASSLLKQETKLEEVLEVLELTHSCSETAMCVDKLDYLHRGGRIGGAEALLGNVFQVKPIIGLVEGHIEAFGRSAGNGSARKKMRTMLEGFAKKMVNPRVGLFHNGNEEGISALREEIRELGLRESMLLSLGTVLSAHMGPGGYGFSIEPTVVWSRMQLTAEQGRLATLGNTLMPSSLDL